jgi:hypothetical protein
MPSSVTDLFADPPAKRCLGCKRTKPLTEFYTQKVGAKTYWQSYCKPCHILNRRKWHFTPAGQRHHRRAQLRTKYRMTPEQYDTMLAAQKSVCAICRLTDTRGSRAKRPRVLAVDHCHKTKRVRALLCSACNSGLASFRDDPSLMRKAAEYIERHAPGGAIAESVGGAQDFL